MIVEPSWLLIFGGCCSNVFTLEAILKQQPNSGLLITVVQFLLTTLFALPSQLSSSNTPSWSPIALKRPNIPLSRLIVMALLFFAVNMLNNWAFAFHISVPLHIILRSFGSVTTLTVGWLVGGKRYSSVQVASVVALTVGVVVSAWADARAKGATMSLHPSAPGVPTSDFAAGLMILFVAQLLSAFMGIYTEQTYAAHGKHWREILFYSHFLGLFFSIALYPTLKTQWAGLMQKNPRLPIPLPSAAAALVASYFPKALPPQAIYLLANAVTQVACISGVNLLSAQTSAVMVTVVLNLRKLASFLLSCVVFGNPVGGMMAVGAAIVFAAGALYGWDESRQKRARAGSMYGRKKSR